MLTPEWWNGNTYVLFDLLDLDNIRRLTGLTILLESNTNIPLTRFGDTSGSRNFKMAWQFQQQCIDRIAVNVIGISALLCSAYFYTESFLDDSRL